jgi:hypothetical protein
MKVTGNEHLTSLFTALANTASKKSVAEEVKGCVAYDGRESLTFNGVPGELTLSAGGLWPIRSR